MVKLMPRVEEMDRERVVESIRAWINEKRECSDEWLKGILRSSELRNVDWVLREHNGEFLRLHPERLLRLGILWNQVRFEDDD